MGQSNDGQKTIMNILMALLTVFSIIIAFNTYNISQNQLHVDKINHQPHFIFQEERDKTNHFEWLIVSNNGFHVNAIEYCYPMTFFEIEYQKDNSTLHKYFLIDGYLNMEWRGDLEKNELFVIGDCGGRPYQIDDFYSKWESYYETGSYYKLHDVRKQIESDSTLKNMSTRVSIKKFVFINYTDVYYEQHEDVYSVDDLYYRKLTEEERVQIWDLYNDCVKKRYVIDLDNFKITRLLSSFNESEVHNYKYVLAHPLSSDVLISSNSAK
jgi:hypothetical protein